MTTKDAQRAPLHHHTEFNKSERKQSKSFAESKRVYERKRECGQADVSLRTWYHLKSLIIDIAVVGVVRLCGRHGETALQCGAELALYHLYALEIA